MAELIPKSILDLSKRYMPIMKKLEARGAKIAERNVAAVRYAMKLRQLREAEEEMRELRWRRRKREALLDEQAFRRGRPGSLLLLRDRWALGRNQNDTLPMDQDIEHFESDHIDWMSMPTAEGKIQEITVPKPQAAISPSLLAKPDQFLSSASMYRERTAARLVCRKCDHTISRGVRGAHLFCWNDNYHIALNEEIADTISFKPITDPAELKKSLWKRAKVACPCCGSNIGSLGVTNARMKVMLKGVCVSWRKTADVADAFTSASRGPTLAPRIYMHQSRPVGTSVPSSWLLSHAGLMTHNRRWVLDSNVITRIVGAGENSPSSDKNSPPQTSDSEPYASGVVRASEKEPAQMTPSMRRLALRSMGFENLISMSTKSGAKGMIEVLRYFEKSLRDSEGAVAQTAKSSETMPEEPATEDAPEDAYENDTASGISFLRFTCAHRMADYPNTEGTKSASTELAQECAAAVKNGGLLIDFIPARTLCGAARFFSQDKGALLALVDHLAERKQSYGPTAGAFGRSAEYLRTALESSKHFSEEEIAEALARCSSPHPSPGGRFEAELEPSGFVELFCTHGNGMECERRATHAPAIPAGQNAKDPKQKIPTHCRIHAPPSYVPTAEGYRGVIPPFEDPHGRQRAGSDRHPGNFSSGWPRKNNRMVDVPDPNETEFTPPEPGTLFMGDEWQNRVKVVYSLGEAKEAIEHLEAHIEKAEAWTSSNSGVPSTDFAIGLDVEWKPEFIYNADNHVCSIIQIATRDKTFVFDAIALGSHLDPVLRRLIRSKDVIKIGHGLNEDLARIAQSMARATGNQEHAKEYFPVESVLELAPLYCKAESKVIPFGGLPSLVAMVEAATGLKLDKRCQMTDWERRPLSPAQVRYAATDAACGLMLFDHFSKKILELSGDPIFDVTKYLQTDNGSTNPQRAGMAAGSSGYGLFEPSLKPSARTSLLFPSSSHSRLGISGRSSYARTSSVPRLANRKFINKHYELRRMRELQKDLISQGVKVDQHAKLEGLEVASEHLQKSLSKVVRESLLDPPGSSTASLIPDSRRG